MAHTVTASRSSDASENPAKHAMDHLAATEQETIDRIAEAANDVQRRMRRVAAKAAVRAKRAQDQIGEAAGENLRKARSYVERNPLTTVGIAFAAGVLLSTWIRR